MSKGYDEPPHNNFLTATPMDVTADAKLHGTAGAAAAKTGSTVES